MSDQWDFYFANVNEKVASLFVDLGIREAAPDADKPWLLWVWVYLNDPDENGMSASEESDMLFQIEDSLREAIENAVGGELVGRITTDGRREFYFYAPTFAGFDDAVARGMKRFPNYQFDADTKQDPEWEQYLGLLYPTPHDWQCIKNRHVLEQLQQHGDPLEKERPVHHWAYFGDESSRNQFVAAVKERRFSVSKVATVDDPESSNRFSVSFERVDRVDWNSINEVTLELFELANALAGDYDGWETKVEQA
jgi:hypothetical protein